MNWPSPCICNDPQVKPMDIGPVVQCLRNMPLICRTKEDIAPKTRNDQIYKDGRKIQ